MKISRDNVRASLEKAVAQKGADFVYVNPEPILQERRECSYVHHSSDGTATPGCIWGHVLADLGVSMGDLGRSDYYVEDGGVLGWSRGIFSVLTDLGVTDVKLLSAAAASQYIQDKGDSWGAALEQFKKVMEG